MGNLAGSLAVISFLASVFLLGYKMGRDRAIEKERDRIRRLFTQAMQFRNSPSLRWVWNAANSDREDLVPEEEFFSSSLGRRPNGDTVYR